MTLDTIITNVGTKLDDNVVPYLWTNEELTEYCNQAINEWCRFTDANIDNTTAAVCTITTTAGTQSYDLHDSILKILNARVTGETSFLEKQHTDYTLALYGPAGLTTRGTPIYYTLDQRMGYISLWPVPIANGSIGLTVSRLPITELSYVTPSLPATPGTGASPDIPPRFHRDLIAGIMYRAYMKNDADTESLARAQMAKAEWEKVLDKGMMEMGLYNYRPQAIMPEYGFL